MACGSMGGDVVMFHWHVTSMSAWAHAWGLLSSMSPTVVTCVDLQIHSHADLHTHTSIHPSIYLYHGTTIMGAWTSLAHVVLAICKKCGGRKAYIALQLAI